MKRMACWTAGGGLLLAVMGAWPANGNLLLNGSLEDGSSSTSVSNWTIVFDSFRETTAAFGYTDGPFPDGSYALKQYGGIADINQDNILVAGDVDMTFRGRFYHSTTQDVIDNSVNSTRMFMHVEWFDADNVSLRHDYSANHNGTSPADTWTTIELTVTAPTGADHATFHVETDANTGGGSLFGDDFYFDYRNLLENPSVESGTGTTAVTSWGPSSGDTFRESQPVFGYTDGAYPDGSYAIKQFGGSADLYQTNITVIGNVPYQMRGEFYHSSSQDVIASSALSTRNFLHVEWLDANGTSLRHDYSANHNGLSPSDVWTQLVMRVTSPGAAAQAVFHLVTDSDTGGGSVFADELFFAQEEAYQFATVFAFK